MIAATKGMTELAKVILELGGDVNIRDKVCACIMELSIIIDNWSLKHVYCFSTVLVVSTIRMSWRIMPLFRSYAGNLALISTYQT